MSIFGRNKKIDEAERRRLRDGLAEFLRLNFRPGNEADTVAAAPVSAEAAQIASLEAQERAMKKAAMALTGNRKDGEIERTLDELLQVTYEDLDRLLGEDSRGGLAE